jgi:tetraacyldisaccharide 4'-kinase
MNRWHARIWAEDCALTRVLEPIARLYGAITGARMMRAPAGRVGIPVIAVGNFTVGGAGKTPTVDHIVRLTREAGLAPVVVTRGYGGRLRGPVRVDPALHVAADVGDEALLHARVAPTIVARDRLAGAREAERMGANLVILDDGFQNPRLAKDLSLVVVDRASGLGNARVMPAGPLRAPLEVQFAKTDALIVVDNGEGIHPTTEGLIAGAAEAGIPVLTARLAARNPDAVKGHRVVGFAGIGRPAKFAATLEACGALVADFVAFPDHHVFTGEEAADLIRRATAVDGDLATTAKDAVRLVRGQGPLARLAAKIRVVEIGLVFDDEMRLARLIAAALGAGARP